jgi:heme/flavin dehydrogenase (mycofactocin system)
MASTREWFETVAEAQRRAKKRLPKSVYMALVAGSEQGVTADDNVAAFREIGFRPHIADLPRERAQATTVLGQDISFPVIISPTGVQAVSPEGEVAVARAAAGADTALGLSSFASRAVEDVAAANPKTFFQIYWVGDKDTILQRVERARNAGAKALIVTLDWSFASRRDWDSPMIPEKMDLKAMLRFAPEGITRPKWVIDFLRHGGIPDLTCPNLAKPGEPAPTFFGAYYEWMTTPLPTWEDVAWLREQWDGPFAVKGIQHPDDARRALDAGATCDLGVQPRRQQPGRHPRLDPGAARRGGRGGRPAGDPLRRRHPARQRRGEGPRARRQGSHDRPGLPVGDGRRRREGRGQRAADPAQRHRRGPARPRPLLDPRSRARGPDRSARLHPRPEVARRGPYS